MDAPVLRGLSHKDAERFIETLKREKSVAEAVIQLEAELKADHDALVPLGDDIEEEISSSERYLAARDRERLIARVDAMRERIDAAHSRT
jgi:hypothetical protein